MLLLDEPFSSLDERLKEKTQNLLKEFCKTHNNPVLLVTHDLSDLKIFRPVSKGLSDREEKNITATESWQKEERDHDQNHKKTNNFTEKTYSKIH